VVQTIACLWLPVLVLPFDTIHDRMLSYMVTHNVIIDADKIKFHYGILFP